MAVPLKKFFGAFDTVIGSVLIVCSLGGLAYSAPTVKTIAFLFFALGVGAYVLVSGIRKLKAR